MSDRDALTRWRLVLGDDAQDGLGCGLSGGTPAATAPWATSTTASTAPRATAATSSKRALRRAGRLATERARVDQRGPRTVPQAHHRAHRARRAGALPPRGAGHEPRPARPRRAEPDAAQGDPAHEAPDEPAGAGPGARPGAQGHRGTAPEADAARPAGVPRRAQPAAADLDEGGAQLRRPHHDPPQPRDVRPRGEAPLHPHAALLLAHPPQPREVADHRPRRRVGQHGRFA